MLGSGFIARFYADALTGQRRKDTLHIVYSRSEERAQKFAADYRLPYHTTSMEEAVNHPEVEVVVIALSNDLHLPAVEACAKAGKHVLCTKPLGRSGTEAKQMLELVEKAGVVGGYLEDLCYTPKFLKSLDIVQLGGLGRVLSTAGRPKENHPERQKYRGSDQKRLRACLNLYHQNP